MADVTMGPGDTNVGTGYPPGRIGATGDVTTGVERKMDELKSRPAEGSITRRLEYQTAKLPSVTYLIAAGASIVGSLSLFAMRRPLSAIFVGLWSPTFLLLGNYNKMVKLEHENRGFIGGY